MKILFGILGLFSVMTLQAIEVSRAKVEIRENKKLAQLSLFLQISEPNSLPVGQSYEIELVKQMKQALFKAIQSKHKLKYHKRFTHIFVTALEIEGTERIAALISKTPKDKIPVISFYPKEAEQEHNDFMADQSTLTISEQIALRDS